MEIIVMPRNKLLLAVQFSAFCLTLPAIAHADTLASFINKGEISGVVRSYYFSKLYGASKKENADAYSLGGILNAKTASLDGFSAGVSFYTANSLGTHGDDSKKVDTTLMGLAPSINALGQAYLQYAMPKLLLIRVGNQVINTPWIGARDSRMLPPDLPGRFHQGTTYSGPDPGGYANFPLEKPYLR